jgi:hypothetical protein
MKQLLCLAAVAALFVQGARAQPVLDSGWYEDTLSAVATDSDASPYVFSLAAPAYFRITDAYIPGDVYTVYNFGSLILATAFNGAQPALNPLTDPVGDAAWVNIDASTSDPENYSHGEILLDAGSYSITVQGDGTGGIPAGFFDRLDSQSPIIPDGGATALLLASAVVGMGCFARRRH